MEIEKVDNITVKSKLEQNDFIKANKIIMKMKKDERKWIVYPLAFFITVVAFLIGIKREINDSNVIKQDIPRVHETTTVPWFLAILPTLVMIFIFVVGFIAFIKFAKSASKRHYESNKLIQDEMIYSFNDSGIECKSERAFSQIKWDEIFKVYISKDFFVIFLSNLTVWIIPKKNVESSNINKLKDIILQKINKKKVRLANY